MAQTHSAETIAVDFTDRLTRLFGSNFRNTPQFAQIVRDVTENCRTPNNAILDFEEREPKSRGSYFVQDPNVGGFG